MEHILEKNGNGPAYLQLYMRLREDIETGVYPFGSRLPSKRTVAAEAGVSVITAEHAYALLCDEGYAASRQRSGYFVTFRTDGGFAHSPERQHPLPELLLQGEGREDFPFSVLARTMRRVVSDYQEGILSPSPGTGCIQLREAICGYLARSRGIHAAPEQLVIGSGSEYLYSLVVLLLGKEKIYAIEAPSYKKIRQVYGTAQVPLRMLPLGGDGIESVALWQSDADVLHISPYRSYPSGVTASASKRHEYMHWAAQAGKWIIEDDFESEFSVSRKPEETLFSRAEPAHVIYMNTFSKTISPSLRIGYMVLPEVLAAQFQEKLGFYSCTVPTYMQLVLAELLNSGDFERHINRVRRKKRNQL